MLLNQLDLFSKPLTAVAQPNHKELLTGECKSIDIQMPSGELVTVATPISQKYLLSYFPTYPAALAEVLPRLIELGIAEAPDECDFLGMKVIGEGWQQEKDSGLKCRNLAGTKTKLRRQGCHLFEISNGEFSVALEFKQFPTCCGAIRAAIPIFIDLRYLNAQGKPVCIH